jgi:hypothetical protein
VAADDETGLSEITIYPDGRVYVFGMSQRVLEVLGTLEPDNARVRHLLECLRAAGASQASDAVAVVGNVTD